jgi:hypothetical protein
VKRCRFKVGDLIIGNINNSYGITNKRTIVKVVLTGEGKYKGERIHTGIGANDNMLVELINEEKRKEYNQHIYSVHSRYFMYEPRYRKLLEIAKVIT